MCQINQQACPVGSGIGKFINRRVLRWGYRTPDAITCKGYAVFGTSCCFVRKGRIVSGQAMLQADLRRNEELAVLAVAGAAGVTAVEGVLHGPVACICENPRMSFPVK